MTTGLSLFYWNRLVCLFVFTTKYLNSILILLSPDFSSRWIIDSLLTMVDENLVFCFVFFLTSFSSLQPLKRVKSQFLAKLTLFISCYSDFQPFLHDQIFVLFLFLFLKAFRKLFLPIQNFKIIYFVMAFKIYKLMPFSSGNMPWIISSIISFLLLLVLSSAWNFDYIHGMTILNYLLLFLNIFSYFWSLTFHKYLK